MVTARRIDNSEVKKQTKKSRRRSDPAVLSLFSGAGGMDIGLEAAGFKTIGILENNETCLKTLRTNRPAWTHVEPRSAVDAARSISPSHLGLQVGQLDLIAAGPPCQPFSSAAQWHSSGRRGMSDERSDTVRATVRFVERLLPRVLLIENVVGFLRDDNGAMKVLDQGLRGINRVHGTSYELHSFILNAADYGVAQHRRRAIVSACRDGELLSPPPPTHLEKPIRAWDAIGDLPDPGRDLIPLGTWAQDLLASIPEGGNYQWLTSKGGGPELFGYRTRYWSFLLKLAKDRPSWTLSASAGPSTGPFHWDNRQLTVRERLRLQGFPDDWILEGSLRAQIRMAGNATPPLLAEIVGREILSQVLGNDDATAQGPSLVCRRKKTIPMAGEPIDIPRHLSHLVGDKMAHPGAGHGPSPRDNLDIT